MNLELAKCKSDVIYFAENYYNYIDFSSSSYKKINLYPFQKKILTDWSANRFNIVNAARQSGITTLKVIFSAWKLLTEENLNIITVSPNLKTSKNFLDKIRETLIRLPKDFNVNLIRNNISEITLSTGASIKVEVVNKILKISENQKYLLIIQDMQWIDHRIYRFWEYNSPLFTSFNNEILISDNITKYDLSNSIYKAALKNESVFKANTVYWHDIPTRDNTWKTTMIESIGEKSFESQFNLNIY